MKRYRLYAQYPSGRIRRRVYKSDAVCEAAGAQMRAAGAATFETKYGKERGKQVWDILNPLKWGPARRS